MAVVTGGAVSSVLKVPSVICASAKRRSMASGTLLASGANIGYTELFWANATPSLLILLSYLSVELTLQPARLTTAAAIAMLRRVFFTILLPTICYGY